MRLSRAARAAPVNHPARDPVTDRAISEARAVDIVGVAERLGARLKRIGAAEFAGPCPVCGGHDRFSANVQKGAWNCRAAARAATQSILSSMSSALGLPAPSPFSPASPLREHLSAR
ncbi:MAG TPA: primase-helicase zinc-binding domain-containing protein [Roseiarcus sp.]|nr:primase-helicase zinc-binding domain-containing protein [Roseiarcus sp.]